MVLEEPASAGFFMGVRKIWLLEPQFSQPGFPCQPSFAAARLVICARSFNEPAAR
ncbi:UNVERIFIED_ORG: hypothetical protein J2W82_006058 [Pseudomonas mohnii]|jgi:hypothetical protein|nr:hypothetical protein [Pseudomonas mohnii]